MFRPLLLKLGLGWLGREARSIAEGKSGPGPQAAYLWLQGKKRWIGFALLLLSAGLVATDNTGAVSWVSGTLGPLLLSLGWIDAKWREEDLPATLEQYTAYRLARNHSADIAAVMGAAALWVSACEPGTTATLARVHMTCSSASTGLAVITGLLVQIGLMAEARLAPAPKV